MTVVSLALKGIVMATGGISGSVLKGIVIATGSISGSVAKDVKTMPVRGHRVVVCHWVNRRQCNRLTDVALVLKGIVIVATGGISGSVAVG